MQRSTDDIALGFSDQAAPFENGAHGSMLSDTRDLAQPDAKQQLILTEEPIAVEHGARENDSLTNDSQDAFRKSRHPQRAPNKWSSPTNRLWIYEWAAVAVSVACFICLVVVLHKSNGKEQTRWLYDRLTLNGLIALLSTFIRASMMIAVGACLSQMKWNIFASGDEGAWAGRRVGDMDIFDQASRGPMGSLKLLALRAKPYVARSTTERRFLLPAEWTKLMLSQPYWSHRRPHHRFDPCI